MRLTLDFAILLEQLEHCNFVFVWLFWPICGTAPRFVWLIRGESAKKPVSAPIHRPAHTLPDRPTPKVRVKSEPVHNRAITSYNHKLSTRVGETNRASKKCQAWKNRYSKSAQIFGVGRVVGRLQCIWRKHVYEHRRRNWFLGQKCQFLVKKCTKTKISSKV